MGDRTNFGRSRAVLLMAHAPNAKPNTCRMSLAGVFMNLVPHSLLSQGTAFPMCTALSLPRSWTWLGSTAPRASSSTAPTASTERGTLSCSSSTA